MVILSWDCWVAASFLLALSVDKVSNKREAYSQAGQSGQRSADLRAGLCRGALWGEHRRLECTEKGPFAPFLSSTAFRAIKSLHTSLSLEHQKWRVPRAHSNPLPEFVALTPCVRESIYGYELRLLWLRQLSRKVSAITTARDLWLSRVFLSCFG